VSEQILNGTSVQLGYTAPIHVDICWKIRTEDKTDITKTKHTQKKQTTQNTAKQNYSGLVAFYDTRPENEVGLFYNAPEPTRDTSQTDIIKNKLKHSSIMLDQ